MSCGYTEQRAPSGTWHVMSWKVCKKQSDVLELICSEVFNQNLLLWLNLKKFQQKTEKFGRPLVAIDAPDTPNLNGFVYDAFSYRNRCHYRV